MKSLRNQVQLIGRLGADPEMREFANGNQKVSINIATSDFYKNKAGEQVTDTQSHNVVAWNGTGKYIKNYMTKGTEVMVQGKLTHSSYEDKNGITRYITEVVADQVIILTKKEKEA
jgi:single-strand DNA-binding protein